MATHVPRLVREAARHAITGAPRPVYLGIPNDIFEEDLPGYTGPSPLDQVFEVPFHRPAPTAADAEAVVRALASATRPIILAGGGIHQSGAHDALRQFAERLSIPVATSNSARAASPRRTTWP